MHDWARRSQRKKLGRGLLGGERQLSYAEAKVRLGARRLMQPAIYTAPQAQADERHATVCGVVFKVSLWGSPKTPSALGTSWAY